MQRSRIANIRPARGAPAGQYSQGVRFGADEFLGALSRAWRHHESRARSAEGRVALRESHKGRLTRSKKRI